MLPFLSSSITPLALPIALILNTIGILTEGQRSVAGEFQRSTKPYPLGAPISRIIVTSYIAHPFQSDAFISYHYLPHSLAAVMPTSRDRQMAAAEACIVGIICCYLTCACEDTPPTPVANPADANLPPEWFFASLHHAAVDTRIMFHCVSLMS